MDGLRQQLLADNGDNVVEARWVCDLSAKSIRERLYNIKCSVGRGGRVVVVNNGQEVFRPLNLSKEREQLWRVTSSSRADRFTLKATKTGSTWLHKSRSYLRDVNFFHWLLFFKHIINSDSASGRKIGRWDVPIHVSEKHVHVQERGCATNHECQANPSTMWVAAQVQGWLEAHAGLCISYLHNPVSTMSQRHSIKHPPWGCIMQ